jgi:hypothetical protein
MKFFLFFSCVFLCTTVRAQELTINADSLQKIYEKETIYFEGNNNYVKGNTRFFNGFFGRKLKNEMKASKEGYAYFLLYRNRAIIGSVLVFVGISLSIGAALFIAPLGIKTALTLIYASGVPTIAGSACITSATQLLNKAVWLRNRDVLKDKLFH